LWPQLDHDPQEAQDRWSGESEVPDDLLYDYQLIYPESVKYLDRNVVTFHGWLERTGRYENAMIIFTADHGQFTGEDNRVGHAWLLRRTR